MNCPVEASPPQFYFAAAEPVGLVFPNLYTVGTKPAAACVAGVAATLNYRALLGSARTIKLGGEKMHQYYYGGEQASVEAADVDAAWKSESRALTLLNRAFEIYYDACNAIKRVDDPELQQTLELSLDKAAKYWYSLYSFPGKVNTLVGAFEHLDKNDGRWTDNNTGSYNGGIGGAGWVQVVPSCAASFLRAVDENIEKLRDCLGSFAQGLADMKKGDEDNKWEKVGKGLEGVEKYGKYVKPLLWLAPEALKDAGETVLEWDEKIAKVHGYASKLMTIGASNQPLDDFLIIGLTEVLNYAPVIGGFYGRIVAEIPGFARHMEEFANNYWARTGGETYRRSIGMGPMFR